MDIRIIKSPSEGTKEILLYRAGRAGSSIEPFDAIGLIQGKMIDLLCAADIAEKSAGVQVFDVRGVCPQHMTLLAVIGDTSSVEDALSGIERKLREGLYCDYSKVD